jgi:predicted protein tyrosine phosphatase
MIEFSPEAYRISIAEVAKNLYIGPAPGSHDMLLMKERGISAILSIMLPHEGTDPIASNAERHGMEWKMVQIVDSFYGGVPEPQQISEAVLIIQDWIGQGRKVYIHCLMAQGRSPLIAVAYRCLVGGERLMTAVNAVKQAWPRADSNAKQIGALCELLNSL